MKKRLASFLLALCVVLQAIPLTVFAAEDCEHTFDQEIFYGVEEGHYPECDRCDYYEEDSLDDHINDDNDDYCDLCDFEVGHEHTFNDGNYQEEEEGHYLICDQCDYYDEASFEAHVNEDKDEEHYCDICGNRFAEDHVYSGKFYYGMSNGHYIQCDLCPTNDESTLYDHINLDNDDYCDLCGYNIDVIYIVLTWGAEPLDLDSHLICTGFGGNAEVAYYSMTHTGPEERSAIFGQLSGFQRASGEKDQNDIFIYFVHLPQKLQL